MFDRDIKLTKNIALWEAIEGTRKDSDPKKIEMAWATLQREHLYNLMRVARLWQLARDLYDKPLIITSGYRPIAWEKIRGRSGNSQHTLGNAIDGYIDGIDLVEVYKFFQEILPNNGGRGLYLQEGFIHLDDRPVFAEWGS